MRIRTIKPEFFTSEDIAALDWNTRLVFIGLWSYVDDNGVGRDSEKLIAAALFPLEDDPHATRMQITCSLRQLSAAGLIVRYIVDGHRFLEIVTWSKHQYIPRPNKPRYPPPTSENAEIFEESCDSHVDDMQLATNDVPGTEEQGNRGTGEEKTCSSAPPTNPIESQRFAEFWQTYPRRQGKGAAAKAYAAAVKKTDPQTLLDAALRYAQDPNREDQFTAMAATWIKQERWNDDPLPSRNGHATSTADQRVAQAQALKRRPATSTWPTTPLELP